MAHNPLVTQGGDNVARVEDLVASLVGEGYPVIAGALIKVSDEQLFLPAKWIRTLGDGVVVIDIPATALSTADIIKKLNPFERRVGEVLLVRDVLGHQLIYAQRKYKPRLVRASDIVLSPIGGSWRVVGIDASKHSLIKFWQKRNRLISRISKRNEKEQDHSFFLDWTNLEPFLSHVPTSRLKIGLRKLAPLYPGEIADLIEAATHAEGEEIIEAVGQDKELQADVFEELDRDHQLEFIANRSDEEVAAILSNMAPDDTADLLGELAQERREPVLNLLTIPQKTQVMSLLNYNPNTAGGLMNPSCICLSAFTSVRDSLDKLKFRDSKENPEILTTVYVVDADKRLSGSITLLELLRSDPEMILKDVSQIDPPRVSTNADFVEVALAMSDYNLTSIAVVDDNDCVVGVVTVDDILALLIPENWRRRSEVSS
ncbi:MAG: CBS domain-containing protein [Actinobacteria bacterium]|nr:CBS domain-containing protein [Actinomycetota bacterium]MCL6105551.1 CBS domain-containing protein [Actinomycetota bacterium]